MEISITINNNKVIVPKGSTILEAAKIAGIKIPTLCHHPAISDVGACRMCVVTVENSRNLLTACTTPITEGMIIDTESQEARETRKFVLEMLLTDHPNDCMTCEVNGDCELQDLVYDYDVSWPEHTGARHTYKIDSDESPFIFVDQNKCILCGRCVRACNEIQNRDVWNFAQRGFQTMLVAGANQQLLDAHCESCGTCVAVCPTGAIFDKMSLKSGRTTQIKKVQTTCSYCGVGCNFDLNVKDNEIVRVTTTEGAPVNDVSLCVKGRYGYDYIHHDDRLKRPLVNSRWLDDYEALVNDGTWRITEHPQLKTDDESKFIETDWDTALEVVTRKFSDVKNESGGNAFALFASAKCTNEENYLFNKFIRQVLTSNSIDHCARL